MAIRQPREGDYKRKPDDAAQEESLASDGEALEQEAVLEEEFHTDPEDEVMAGEEFHTDPEDASDDESPRDDDPALLPPELLKAKPVEALVARTKPWDQLSQKEKKELRDVRGVSMRQLREEAHGTGVIEAGKAAQMRRGVRPADKVAGGRIVKKRRRKDNKPVLSGKQKLLQQRQIQSGTRPAKQRNG